MTLSKEQCREIIAKRIAQEFKHGDVITLGIGLPTEAANYLPEGLHIVIQSENGMLGVGSRDFFAAEHPKITNAGGQPVLAKAGAVFFDTAMSFAIIRGGHVDATVLGALQVDEHGNIANWMIPGSFVPGMGGAMDLLVGSKKVIVAMEHKAKGEPKILKNCTLPLTATGKVNRIITERAVMDVTPDGLVLKEVNPLFSIDDVIGATGAELIIPDVLLKWAE